MKISMILLMSSLSLKLYLNSLVYDLNVFGRSSKVFANLRKISENVRERLPGPVRTILKIFGKLRKLVGNLRKILGKSYV